MGHDELLILLAEELEAVHLRLEAVGVHLCNDPEVTRRHLTDLQSLDHIGQRCSTIATILRSDDRLHALRTATLEAISARVATHPVLAMSVMPTRPSPGDAILF